MSQPEVTAADSFEAEALAAVMSAYGIDTTQEAPVRQGGAVNHVLRVPTPGDDVIVRIHRPETSVERIFAVHHIQDILRGRGLPVPRVYRTRAGASWTSVEGRIVEVIAYLPGGHEVERPDDGLPVFAALGRVHAVMRTVDGTRFPPPVHASFATPQAAMELLEVTCRQVAALAREPGYREAARVQHLTAEVLQDLDNAWGTYEASLPRTLVHGDFVGNNVLLSGADVVAILDFDRLAVRHRVHDIAYTLMYVLSRLVRTGHRRPARSGGLTVDELQYLARLLEAYAGASGWSLTEDEIRALPYEMARAPLYPIVAAGQDLAHAIAETLDFGAHVPLCSWLVQHASAVSGRLREARS